MNLRDRWIAQMRRAGYHNDTKASTRLLVEARVNRQTLNEAWAYGVRAKEAGMRCSCFQCNREGNQPS